jgi:hypothetical protein
MQKKFIDCGGTMREQQTCQLQAWVGPDEDHRIASGKMADILNKASSFLPSDDLPLEIEYEDVNISQHPVAEAIVSDDAGDVATDDETHRVPGAGVVHSCRPVNSALVLRCGPTGCC